MKLWLIAFGLLALVAGTVSACVMIYKTGGTAAVTAYKLAQTTADNAELKRVMKERDDAVTKLQKNEQAIIEFKGDNPPVSAGTRALYRRMCRDYPESCDWKDRLPADPKPGNGNAKR